MFLRKGFEMSKPMKQKTIILTVVIVIAIITAAFFAMTIGRNIIINSESYSAEKRFEKLTDDLLKEYNHYNDVHVEGYFNDKNRTGMIAAVEYDRKKVLKLYINYNEIGIYEPISSLTSELNRMFEMDTEGVLIDFCDENDLEYEKSTISDMDWEKFSSWFDKL